MLGDIPNTPGVHGAGIATKHGHGFTTNGGDQTVTMFDLKTLEVVKQIKVGAASTGSGTTSPTTGYSQSVGVTGRDAASSSFWCFRQ